ncbi:copper resistance protein B [Litorivivens lipolytica]|uniref:Copper resistance protein B n=1 Tax=Litorivivens lipolytica TaxID=1524264 RepID=A0A7W4Z4U3_9GAMM|nr:copper resistance protein B [Litorivivens lipolytica]MBB3046442.1 copper resistance protein B [Litorivivens lipolytica]
MNTVQKLLVGVTLVLSAFAVQAGAKNDPFLTSAKIDQFEVRSTEGPDPQVLEGNFWAGYDLNKLWVKAEAEHVDSEYEELELQALHSRAISTYWNLQVGARRDFEPEPKRDWGVIALQGLAPYFFEIDASLFMGGAGRTALRLSAEYELMLTQRLILSPEIELNAFGFNDEKTAAGSGLADAEIGLRLRYEIRREFAPYIGVNWKKKYGNTVEFARRDGDDIEDAQIVIGFRAWY